MNNLTLNRKSEYIYHGKIIHFFRYMYLKYESVNVKYRKIQNINKTV